MAGCVSDGTHRDVGIGQAAGIALMGLAEIKVTEKLAEWQRSASGSIINMQQEIADRQMVLAENIHAHAKNFWPEEEALIVDTFGQDKFEIDHYVAGSQAMSEVAGLERKARPAMSRDLARRCLPAKSRAEDRMFSERWRANTGRISADIMNFHFRHEEAKTEALNDRRYARQLSVLAMGKGIMQTVASFETVMGMSGLTSAGMITDTINSGLTALGYFTQRLTSRDSWGAGFRQTVFDSAGAGGSAGSRPVIIGGSEGATLGRTGANVGVV